MFGRRQFLAATGAASMWPVFSGALRADDQLVADRSSFLSWNSEAVQTLPLNAWNEAPVVTGLDVHPSGEMLAIVGDDHTIHLLDLTSMDFVDSIRSHRDWVRAVRYSPDGRFLVSTSNDHTARITTSADYAAPGRELRAGFALKSVAISPDSRWVAVAGFGSDLFVHELASQRLHQKLRCPCNDMHAIGFAPDGRRLAAAGRSGVLQMWEVETGRALARHQVHRSRVRALQFVDDQRVVSCGDDCLVKITNLETQQVEATLPRHGGKLYCLHQLPNGTLVTGGSDNLIYVWNLEDNSQLGVLRGHTGTISCLSSANGKLYSGSYDTQLRIWSYERNA